MAEKPAECLHQHKSHKVVDHDGIGVVRNQVDESVTAEKRLDCRKNPHPEQDNEISGDDRGCRAENKSFAPGGHKSRHGTIFDVDQKLKGKYKAEIPCIRNLFFELFKYLPVKPAETEKRQKEQHPCQDKPPSGVISFSGKIVACHSEKHTCHEEKPFRCMPIDSGEDSAKKNVIYFNHKQGDEKPSSHVIQKLVPVRDRHYKNTVEGRIFSDLKSF